MKISSFSAKKPIGVNGCEIAARKYIFAPIGTITHLGGGSSGSLNHKRDLMLTQATIRLHLKHHGWFHASCVFLLLLMFNLSRAAFWSISSLFKPKPQTTNRMHHFIGVCRHFNKTWPHEKGVSL